MTEAETEEEEDVEVAVEAAVVAAEAEAVEAAMVEDEEGRSPATATLSSSSASAHACLTHHQRGGGSRRRRRSAAGASDAAATTTALIAPFAQPEQHHHHLGICCDLCRSESRSQQARRRLLFGRLRRMNQMLEPFEDEVQEGDAALGGRAPVAPEEEEEILVMEAAMEAEMGIDHEAITRLLPDWVCEQGKADEQAPDWVCEQAPQQPLWHGEENRVRAEGLFKR